ncbi:hypothetical protein PM082_006443 [Marasmius tenuissimus]|nr:hypothetical protein PM082_006443 [Marasmius tenuissimus]
MSKLRRVRGDWASLGMQQRRRMWGGFWGDHRGPPLKRGFFWVLCFIRVRILCVHAVRHCCCWPTCVPIGMPQ